MGTLAPRGSSSYPSGFYALGLGLGRRRNLMLLQNAQRMSLVARIKMSMAVPLSGAACSLG